MKKLILVLAIALIASPVFAELVVGLEAVDGDTFAVVYSGADAENLPRAFALTLTIDGTGSEFDSFVDGSYYQGESTAANPKFGIYPARIDILSDGSVNNYGTPEAQTGDPGTTGTGFGTSTLILEFGSLYFGDVNAPATSGTLCQINYTKGTGATQISMEDEDTYRGGLVLEDGTLGEVDTFLTLTTPPGPATNGTPVANVTTATGGLGTDLGWTAGAGATSYDVYFGTIDPPPFLANVATTTRDVGTMVQGKVYYAKVVAKNADGEAAPLAWSFGTDCMKQSGVIAAEWTAWVGGGTLPWARPSCWCYQRQCRGEVNNNKQGAFWVYTQDLIAMKDAYGKLDAQMTGDRICSDINHSKQGSFRVYTQDLTTLKAYYGKLDAQTPVCDVAKVNFWTN